jgi:transcriptional regulator with XRE-family HTH domain
VILSLLVSFRDLLRRVKDSGYCAPVTQEPGGGADVVSVVAARMRHYRKYRGMSAAKLAEEMSAQGVPWKRDIVANLEAGRRRTVDVGELLALAVVLEIPPALLLIDIEAESSEITPKTAVLPYEALLWTMFGDPLPGQERRYQLGAAGSAVYYVELLRAAYADIRNLDRAMQSDSPPSAEGRELYGQARRQAMHSLVEAARALRLRNVPIPANIAASVADAEEALAPDEHRRAESRQSAAGEG